jgi:hypothetical protein
MYVCIYKEEIRKKSCMQRKGKSNGGRESDSESRTKMKYM